MKPYVLIWGGGDLASGVAMRLHHTGMRLLVVETAQPLAVRRSVSFAQAVYDGSTKIEDIIGRLAGSPKAIAQCWENGEIPVTVDPDLEITSKLRPLALVDARMRKKYSPISLEIADLVIGLGPGFIAQENCHAAIETNRGHFLGRVYWEGSPEPDTGIPGTVAAYSKERVLHAPAEGIVVNHVQIGDRVNAGDATLSVTGENVYAPFDGVVRGLIHEGIHVRKGVKVGDVDPRPETFRCWYVSEKSLAIGGGVLEALLTREDLRLRFWSE